MTESDTDTDAEAPLMVSPLLLRVLARALMPADALVTRDEAIELLPLGPVEGRTWFDRHVKGSRAVGHHTLFRWGDVAAAFSGFAAPASKTRDVAAPTTGYMTVSDAAAYLGFPTTHAFRAAVYRGLFKVSARRGRVWLFRREDLDRDVGLAPAKAAATTETAPPTGEGSPPQKVEPARVASMKNATPAFPKNDPYGIRATLARMLAEDGK